MKYLFSGSCIYSNNVACESYANGRCYTGDGNVDTCIQCQKTNNRAFAVFYNGRCYGSSTCSSPSSLSGAVNYQVEHCSGILMLYFKLSRRISNYMSTSDSLSYYLTS